MNTPILIQFYPLGRELSVQGNLDLADTDLAENLDSKATLQKIWATIFDF